jgi:predicted AAA+ superfamily ATPase
LPESRALIQVSQSLAQPATRGREVRALIDAMRGLGLDRGLILTDRNETPITENGFTIAIRSLVEWLLQPEQQGK